MKKIKSRKKRLQVFVLGLLSLSVITFTACSNNNNMPNNTTEEIESDDSNENTKEPTQLIGFVSSIDETNKTISFDDIEWITLEDKDRITELGLSEDDLSSGFHIYNPDESIKSITYNDLGSIYLYETSEDVKQITVTINEFKELLDQHSILCQIVLEDNVIKSISEKYLP